jgi:predicted MFS family arabinose efflux permease
LAAALSISPLMLMAMLFTSGAMLFAVLLALGFTTLSTGPVLMAAMLENAGPNPAAANSMYMAASFAVRSVIVIIIGAMSDTLGMHNAFMICAVIAFLGLPFIFLLPK